MHSAAKVSLTTGIYHPRQKNSNTRGLARGGGEDMGAPGIDKCISNEFIKLRLTVTILDDVKMR